MTDNKFLIKLKEKTSEYGITVKSTFLETISSHVNLLQSVIGNELILATFVPMIPSLIVDHIKQEIFKEHIPDLGERFSREQARLNTEYIKSREGQKLLRKHQSDFKRNK